MDNQKVCGECTACCTAFELTFSRVVEDKLIPYITKPMRVHCPAQIVNHGFVDYNQNYFDKDNNDTKEKLIGLQNTLIEASREVNSIRSGKVSLPIITEDNRNGNGCSIYNDRPKQCRTFNCMWLIDKLGNNKNNKYNKISYRPDKLGLIFTGLSNSYHIVSLRGMLAVYRSRVGKLSGKAKSLLRELEKRQLYFFDEKLWGPQHLIEQWKRKYDVN